MTNTAEVDGVRIGYDDVGNGPALVLVHGHPFDRTMWRPQRDSFGSAGWRVVVPDLRGYGTSTVVPGTTPLSVFADDIVALLDQLGVDRGVFAGLSMGGQIVMELHRLYPERVRALVLADTTPRAETGEGRRQRREMAQRLEREGLGPYADEVLDTMIAPSNVESMPAVARHVSGMMRNAPAAGAAAALRGRAERPDYLASLSAATVPALVVVGSDDEFTPVADAELIAHTIPDAQLAVVDGAAHLPNLERSVEFDRVLDDFLKQLAVEGERSH